jgi:hypothetical protein
LVPLLIWKSMKQTWAALPAPTIAPDALPGLARSHASNSGRFVAGTAVLPTIQR